MTQSLPLLSLLIWLPILGGALTLMLGNARPQAARWLALVTALVAFALSIPLFTGFDYTTAGMQFTETKAWIPAYDIRYALGADDETEGLNVLSNLTSVRVLRAEGPSI